MHADSNKPDATQPVAWRYWNEKSRSWSTTTSSVVADVMRESGRAVESLYAAPQASEAVRTPDYTLQHADHMAVSAEQLMEAINARDAVIMQREESDDVDDETMQEQHENISEYLSGMRNAIYEYRKRRNRAALSAQPSGNSGELAAQKPPPHGRRRT